MNSEIDNYTLSIYTLKDNNFDFGLNDYPIFDETYRPILNNAILEYYMFREIGFANPAVFRQRLRNRMDIIMRNKYNALYTAKAKEFNPLYTMELYEDYTHSINNTGQNANNGTTNFNTTSSTTTSTSENSDINSNDTISKNNNGLSFNSTFPSEEMTEDNLSSNLFADSATKSNGTETTIDNSQQTSTLNNSGNTSNSGIDKTTISNNGTSSNNMSETYSKKTYGSASDLSFAHAMTQFKDYCDQYQLDQQVIDELKDLFIQIW